MTSCNSNIVQIVESCAELWANQRISRWVELSSHAVWLETKDSSGDEIDIISPSCNDRVPLYRLAWNSGCGEALFEPLPSLSEGDFLAILVKAISNERIFSIAV
jgi:hypothetical protein